MIEFLFSAVPLLLAGGVGFLFGLLRDRSNTRAERRVKHQDQVLEASAHVLDASATLGKANQGLAHVAWEMSHGRSGTSKEYLQLLEERRQDLFATINGARTAAQPHLMKLTILAPELDEPASQILFDHQTGHTPEAWNKAALAQSNDRFAFTTAVQEHLRITGPKSARQWRPWVSKPFKWFKRILLWVRSRFLV